MTLCAVPRRNLMGNEGALQLIAAMTVEQLKKVLQLGIFGEPGKPPTQSAISIMHQKVIFFVLGGCHTLTAWRNVFGSADVRHPNGIVDSDYIGVFRDDL
jgi:hypothetical protein